MGIFRLIQAAKPTPQDALKTLEANPGTSLVELYFALRRLAVTAFDASEYDKAERYATQLLTTSTQMPR